MKKTIGKVTLFSVLSYGTLLLMSGCSTGPQVQEYPDTANAVDEVRNFSSDMEVGSSQINVLSPHNYKEACALLDDAKKSLDKQKDAKVTLHDVAKGRAYLKRAQEVVALSRANMDDVVIARQEALNAGAPAFFASDFQEADDRLRDVTSELEKNDLKGAEKNRSALQASYLTLEVRAIKKTNLGQAQATIAEAIKDGAKDFAPQSLAIAEKNYNDVEAYITANRHDTEEVTARSQMVKQSAEHLLAITHASKDGKKVSSEERALQMESKQNQVNSKTLELATERGASQSLQKENQALESERDFSAKFEKARREFTKNEAEVYRQGDRLTIRLRGLEFPTDQAVLRDSNFPLLAKVQHVIKDFGQGTVVVEGYTDSEGGKDLNAKLSEHRAQAVRTYLISNDTIAENKITAVGYGYERPLASNKTVAGRAQNRRVDVVLRSDSSSTQTKVD